MDVWTLKASSYRLGHRLGWVLKASSQRGQVRWGEVLLSQRRETEPQAAAQAYLDELSTHTWSTENWPRPPLKLPACKAGLELLRPQPDTPAPARVLECSHLVPLEGSPQATLKALRTRHAKVKVAQGPLLAEQSWVRALAQGLHEHGGTLKLDANGRWTLKEAQNWLSFLDTLPGVAYVEQPLPPGQETTLLALARDSATPLALDESLTQPYGLQRALDAHWPGVFAIKPLLSGLNHSLFEAPDLAARIVLSCAWETVFGLQSWIEPAQKLPLKYPIGLMDPCVYPDGRSVPAPVSTADMPFALKA